MSYKEYLKNNPYWESVKRIVKERDQNQCGMCSNKTQLQVHHITYKVNRKTIVGNELQHLKWLITLCEKCHEKVHNNKKHSLHPKSFLKINANDWFALKGIKL